MSGFSAIALGAALTILSVGTADASYYYYYGQSAQPGSVYLPAQQRPAVKKQARRPKAEQPKKDAAAPHQPRGPLTIVVSLGEQRARVFDATGQIAEAPVSSGTKAHPTFTGVFSVIQKDRYHHSNLYNNAPMPYMQRLTWSGTAMHTGVLPGYAASHGCIRLPNSFASQLWGMTKLGTRVVVARSGVTPVDISHPQLALLKRKPDAATPIADSRAAGKSAAVDSTVSDAPSPAVPSGEPLAAEPAPTPAVEPVATPAASPAADTPAPAAAAPAPSTPLVEYGPPRPMKPGPVSIFVSKKEGKLFVRKGFEPIYETPITFARPDAVLGTHVFTATAFEDDGQALRWTALSLPPELRAEPTAETRKGKGAKAAAPAIAAATPTASAKDALDRVQLPAEAVERLAELMSPGASLIVSDKGLGSHTGRGTDFIVLSR
ncbi:MAG: L,D-transpeptidase [Rhodoplanes sp.]|uniref:L,D-transpeptidase n=1 Tax=Rhodoplanes sp. TaxID=1968906 RepID=UPI00184B0527|nr:L,D-transpeptidase [Rhodoplanes sp.]NVO14698.1 L,D-transpeptidase [Rhodoplanes sp.]